MKARILFAMPLAAALLLASCGTALAVIHFDFEGPSDQGWTDVLTSSVANANTDWNVVTSWPRGPAHSGSAGVAPGTGANPNGWNQRDGANAPFVFRSPAFNLEGSGDLTYWMFGGRSNGPAPGNFSGLGVGPRTDFLGVALRDNSTGDYVLAKGKEAAANGSNNGDHWAMVAMTQAELAPYVGGSYTLDLIDDKDNGWGWGLLDDVTVPGNFGPVRHEVAGDNTIGTESLTGTEQNAVTAPLTGATYVRVVQNLSETFQVAELQAFETGTGINKAEQSQGGVATARDVGYGGTPDRANDGNTNMNWGGGSIWHSGSGTGTWLQIELASPTDLDSVHFWGRTDCCENRQGDFNLIIEDASNAELFNERIVGLGSTSPYHGDIPVSTVISADLVASLNAHDHGAGYTYVFELGSADMIEVEDPDGLPVGDPNNVFTTYLHLNDAAIEVELLSTATVAVGDVFDLLDADYLQGTYNSLVLPELGGGLYWDDSNFLTDGTLAVLLIPEPSTLLIWSLLAGLALGLGWRRRKR